MKSVNSIPCFKWQKELQQWKKDRWLPSPMKGDIYEHPNPLVRWSHWRRLHLALQFSQLSEQEVALDIGTGRGFLLLSLLPQYSRVYAIDVNQAQDGNEFREWARGKSFLWWAGERTVKLGTRARARLFLAYADGAFLPFKTESIDIVYCLDVLEHMPLELRPKVISESFRVLKPGGELVALLPREKGFPALLRSFSKGLSHKEG